MEPERTVRRRLGGLKYQTMKRAMETTYSTLYYGLDRLAARRLEGLPENTLVIAGFWRSGTTWLQQAVASAADATTVFEPFDPKIDEYRLEVLPTFERETGADMAYAMPYADGDIRDQNPILFNYLERCWRSEIPGFWVRSLRGSPMESFRDRAVVKFVRGHLCLRGMHQTFGLPVLFISRDPRSVVASVLRDNWAEFFGAPFLVRTLLEAEDGRAELFAPWASEIAAADAEGTIARLATYWAVLEHHVHGTAEQVGDAFCAVDYRSLIEGDYSALQSFLSDIGFDVAHADLQRGFRRDSEVTQAGRHGISDASRQFSWQRELSADDIATIERIVATFGLERTLS